MIGGKVVSKTTGRCPLESQGVSLGRSLRLSELPISDRYLDFSGEFLVPPPPATPLVQSYRICSNFIKVSETI